MSLGVEIGEWERPAAPHPGWPAPVGFLVAPPRYSPARYSRDMHILAPAGTLPRAG